MIVKRDSALLAATRPGVGSEVDRHDRGVARDEGYLLDNQHAQAGRRFDALSVLFNPSTFQYARALGLAPGWRGVGGWRWQLERACLARRAGRA